MKKFGKLLFGILLGLGGTASAYAVPVGNQAPVALISGPLLLPFGSDLTLDGSNSVDPNPGDTLTYKWHFGSFDSSTSSHPVSVFSWVTFLSAFPSISVGSVVSILLTVTDPFDAHDITSSTVTVTEALPAPTPLPAALPLFASGLGAMGLFAWRRKRKGGVGVAA